MSLRKYLFIDRDGCLIAEPADEQIDSFEKFALMPGVIPALLRLRAAGYRFVMVSNQDGLGTPAFPEETFRGPHQLLMQILDSQGLGFDAVHIDRHFPADQAPTRKPGTGMLTAYLASNDWDRSASAVIGDRLSDLELARNMGLRGFRVGPEGLSWTAIAEQLLAGPRRAEVERQTKETRITVRVDLDAAQPVHIATGIGFFDHMLEQIARHAELSLELHCSGDLHIDEHHTVEDCALALGEALRKSLGDKRGIQRYGFLLPMDETRVQVALDLSGRAYFVLDGEFPRDSVGGLHTEMVSHFFRSLCDAMGANLHLILKGENTHHMVEACFKGFARAFGQAKARQGDALPSTKGVL